MSLQTKKIPLAQGDTKALPTNKGQVFTAGVGWDPAAGQDTVDLDLWLIRTQSDGNVECAFWGNQKWQRPDLGTNGSGSPYIASPEGDVVHKGDDLTGAESDTGYDETIALDLSKAPATVTQYALFATIYSDANDKTLGMATNVICGVKEENSGNEYTTELADDHGFDLSVLICTIDNVDGKWKMTNKDEGYDDPMPEIAKKLGVVGFP